MQKPPQQQKPHIIVIQEKPQQWAAELQSGFVAGLKDQGLEQERDYLLVVKDSAGDPTVLSTIVAQASRGDYAAVFTLGTKASQAYYSEMTGATKGSMIFGAVTDPIAAGFYERSPDRPKKNLTGSQDLWPYKAQFDLIHQLLPKARKIGTLYSPNEVNSQASMAYVREQAHRINVELIEKSVPSIQEIESATAALLASSVDAIYIPADDTMQSSARVIIAQAKEKKIPVFTGISGIVKSDGAVATVGTNYREVGRVNGSQAAQIIRGALARSIRPAIASTGDLYLNIRACQELGIAVPDDLLKHAIEVYR